MSKTKPMTAEERADETARAIGRTGVDEARFREIAREQVAIWTRGDLSALRRRVEALEESR